MTKPVSYKMPENLNAPTDGANIAANIAFFMLENGNDIWGKMSVSMAAKDQRALFGKFLGKGKLLIDSLEERVTHYIKVDFGNDFTATAEIRCKF